MVDKNTFTIISICLNFLGTASLAFAANKYFKAVNSSFFGAEKNIESLTNLVTGSQPKIPIFEGFDVHRQRGYNSATRLTYLGLSLIGLGIIFQMLTLKQ